MSSGPPSVGGGVVQTGRLGTEPVRTVLAPAPDIQFRTTVGETPASSLSAGISGIGATAPVLDSGPAFEVISGDASSLIIGTGAGVAESMPVDIGGAASGQVIDVNPTIMSSGTGGMSATPVGNTPVFQAGATLSMAEPTIRAATSSAASMGTVTGEIPINGALDIQTGGLLPTMGSMDAPGSSAIVPGAANVPTTIGLWLRIK